MDSSLNNILPECLENASWVTQEDVEETPRKTESSSECDDLPVLTRMDNFMPENDGKFAPKRKSFKVITPRLLILDEERHLDPKILEKLDYHEFYKPYRGIHQLDRLSNLYRTEKLSESNAELYRNLSSLVNFKKAEEQPSKVVINELPKCVWPSEKRVERFENVCQEYIVEGRKRFHPHIYEPGNKLLDALNQDLPKKVQVTWNNNVYDVPKHVPCVKCEENLMLTKKIDSEGGSDLKLRCKGCKRVSSFAQYIKNNVDPPNNRRVYDYFMEEPLDENSVINNKEEEKLFEVKEELYIS